MRTLFAAAVCAGLSLPVSAQPPAIDFGVAAELVRNMMSEQVGQNILASTNLMSNYRNYALEQEIAQEAARRGLTERIDVQRAIEETRRDILIQAVKNDVIRAARPPTDEKIARETEALSAQLVAPPALKLDVYSISGRQTQHLEWARAQLAAGEDVEARLAERGFVHVTAQNPDPWFTANRVAAPIWTRLTAMTNGEAEVFPDGNNYLLVRRLDARSARPMTAEESHDLVRARLLRESQEKLWSEFIEQKARALGL
ncbi:MAG: hypothetical protein KA248_00590 [Kiritimatiellae bacterium]|nr:hypothetical protein [Kiritimatiellia bacterium]